MEHGVNPLVQVCGMGGRTSDACGGCFFQCWGASTAVQGSDPMGSRAQVRKGCKETRQRRGKQERDKQAKEIQISNTQSWRREGRS